MRRAVGCVADASEVFLEQAWRLLQSWRWFAGSVADAPFHVCVVGGAPEPYRRRYAALGATVHAVERFGDRHPTGNKLRFFEVAEVMAADHMLLLDCDVAVVQDPADLFASPGLTAKLADVATVSVPVFERAFAHFGLPMPPAVLETTVWNHATIPYFNSGVISLSRDAAHRLAPTWTRFNGELAGVFASFGGEAHFCEQASLSLALVATGVPYRLVGNAMNFPAHFRDQPLDTPFAQEDPVLIHYHSLVDANGRLLPSRYPRVNQRIAALNARLAQAAGAARDDAHGRERARA
ncbi:MAG: hypothetical protein JNM90_10910 [Burkholderiales bacterium]|nr:hypothetical protein [Burkholderiales bacterium]